MPELAPFSSEDLRVLIEGAPAAIAIFKGPAHVISFANALFCSISGRSAGELANRPLLDVFPGLRDSPVTEILDRVYRSGEAVRSREFRVSWNREDNAGSSVYFDWSCQPVRDRDGKVCGTLQFFYDVTESALAREAIEAARADAMAANRSKDEFLAMLGHELRNPLSPIVTALQLMRLRGLASREQDVLERQVGHLTRLVDDLLDVSRITRGKITLDNRDVDLGDIVAKALEAASPLLERKRQRVDVRLAPGGLMLHVDPDRITQVLSNLLNNAAKFSDVGGAIVLGAERDRGLVRIRVKDYGMGIEPERLESVFEQFVQEPQTIERSRGGLGLGLAIVRSLVELHGGSVRAYSEGRGRGAEFLIELPAAEALGEREQGRRESVPPEHVGGATAKRILVVDDNEDAARTLQSALEQLGHVVRVAHDGPSALEVATGFDPQVALLDIGLPVMDGYELAQRLRHLRGTEDDIRLIAVTGYGQEGDRQRSLAAGFEQHLVKPVDLEKLGHVVVERVDRAVAPS